MTIINHDYRFVFVHIPKNAGTSVAHYLAQLSGYDMSFGELFDGELRADRAGLSALAHSWLAAKASSGSDDATTTEVAEPALLQKSFDVDKGYRPDEQPETTAGKSSSLKSGLIDWSSKSIRTRPTSMPEVGRGGSTPASCALP